MANYGDYFSEAFTKSYQQSAQNAFDKWKTERESKDTSKLLEALQLKKLMTEMGYGGQGVPTNQNVNPQVMDGPMQTAIPPVTMRGGNIPFIAKDLNMFGQPTGYERDPVEMATVIDQAKERGTLNLKRSILRKDLDPFFAVDDVIQRARGSGWGRLGAGAQMWYEGKGQNTTLGRAAAMHSATSKRLRVQLVRAAGDVGNLNIVEQKAAEEMVPGTWDDAKTAEIKRAYLKQISKAIDDESPDEVQKVMNKFLADDISSVKKFIVKGKEYYIPNAKVEAFKKAKGVK